MTTRSTTTRFLPAAVGMLMLGFGTSLGAFAAVPVEESRASYATEAPRPGAIDARSMSDAQGGGGASTESSRLTELFYQLQVLQQEVQELRGTVEEQRHQLDRLARDQQEQYLDLDRRMQALRGGGQPSPSSSGSAAASTGSAPAAAGSGARSEREAYAAAFDLMKQRQFDASASAFEQLVAQYPNGAYTPNAFYWLGELNLAQDDNEQARQYFAQVVNLYPDHQKVPDALYKLGVAYHRLGDLDRAREYLNQVRSEHPQSSAAGLAQTYLAEL